MGLKSSGGYTGDGGKYDAAGVVHRGGFVMTKGGDAAYWRRSSLRHDARLR